MWDRKGKEEPWAKGRGGPWRRGREGERRGKEEEKRKRTVLAPARGGGPPAEQLTEVQPAPLRGCTYVSCSQGLAERTRAPRRAS